jgi:hypothetical protein
VTLIDTPGHDDTSRSDSEVLELVMFWLKKAGIEKNSVKGVIFIHRITDNRIIWHLRSFIILKKMFGPKYLDHFVVATTMWDTVDLGSGEDRERYLKRNIGRTIAEGVKTCRHDRKKASAEEIVRQLLQLVG